MTNLKFNPSIEKTIHEVFENIVKEQPKNIAIQYGESKLTYFELNNYANKLANILHRKGVGPEDVIAINMSPSLKMIGSILAIMKSGAAYLPIVPSLPSERKKYILQNAKAKVILTDEEFNFPLAEVSLVFVDNDLMNSREKYKNLGVKVKADNLAYVIYTSGSTGKPKGVMVEHKHLINQLCAYDMFVPTPKGLVGSAVCPFSFDVSVIEFFSVLCFGGTLVIPEPDEKSTPEQFSEFILKNRINSVYIPPALLSDVATCLNRNKKDLTIKRLLVGVEPIKQELLQRYVNLSDDITVVNGYGPTETTIWATFYKFERITKKNNITPIGKAIFGYKVYLLDSKMQPVPQGEAGELYIGGLSVARGYINNPELTIERFINDPFDEQPGSKLYKTGDYAKELPDGNIEFIGRKDFQVKVRGHRVELQEIEIELQQVPGIKQAVVAVHKGNSGVDFLYAFYTAQEKVEAERIKKYLLDTLPEYMVPWWFIQLDKFPLTSNGKTDRKALAEQFDKTASIKEYVASRNETEEILVSIWKEVLNVEQVGVHDNFFHLGGYSIKANQLLYKINDTWGIDLSLKEILEEPVVSDIAEQIDNVLWLKEGRLQDRESESIII